MHYAQCLSVILPLYYVGLVVYWSLWQPPCGRLIKENSRYLNDVIMCKWGRRGIGISGSLIWSKTLMELIFNPYGEFRRSPEGPVSQIHSPYLLVGAPGIFSDLLRFVQMLKREWDAESNGKLPHLFNPSKTAT